MVKLTDFFRFDHKMLAEGLAPGITGVKDFDPYLVVPFPFLASAVDIRHSSLADTLQQEVITQHYAFKIRHTTPRQTLSFSRSSHAANTGDKNGQITQYIELNGSYSFF